MNGWEWMNDFYVNFIWILTMVLLWHCRQTSGLVTPAQLLCLLQLHCKEQLSPTNPKWHRQTPGETHVPFKQPCAHTGPHWPERLERRITKEKWWFNYNVTTRTKKIRYIYIYNCDWSWYFSILNCDRRFLKTNHTYKRLFHFSM